MMNTRSMSRAIGLLTLLFLFGCSSLEPPADANLISPLAAIAASRTTADLSNTATWHADSVEQANAPQSTENDASLTWPDPGHAQRWAIRNAPRVSELMAKLQASQAENWNESILENPGFELGFLEPEDGSGRWQLEAGLELGLADWLTRSARVDRADATHLVNQLEVLDSLNDYLHQIRHYWLSAVAARQQLAVHQGLYLTAETMLEMAQQVQAAGNMNELDFLVYENEYARQQRSLQASMLEADIAVSELQSVLGLSPQQRPVLPDQLPDVPALDSLALADAEQAMRQAELNQPRLRLLQEALNQQLAAERLVRRQYSLLDGAVQIGGEREPSGERRIALGASVELPLFDRGQAHLAEIEAQKASVLAQIDQIRNETRHLIAQSLSAQRVAIEQAWQVSQEDLPRHQRMLELALQEYNFMLRDTFSLLTLREQIFDVQLEYIDHTLAYWDAQSLLLNATGVESNGLSQTGESE